MTGTNHALETDKLLANVDANAQRAQQNAVGMLINEVTGNIQAFQQGHQMARQFRQQQMEFEELEGRMRHNDSMVALREAQTQKAHEDLMNAAKLRDMQIKESQAKTIAAEARTAIARADLAKMEVDKQAQATGQKYWERLSPLDRAREVVRTRSIRVPDGRGGGFWTPVDESHPRFKSSKKLIDDYNASRGGGGSGGLTARINATAKNLVSLQESLKSARAQLGFVDDKDKPEIRKVIQGLEEKIEKETQMMESLRGGGQPMMQGLQQPQTPITIEDMGNGLSGSNARRGGILNR